MQFFSALSELVLQENLWCRFDAHGILGYEKIVHCDYTRELHRNSTAYRIMVD
jgi:hypothetical protein